MRIEETQDSIPNVDEDYADFSLSKYKLIAKVLDEGFFMVILKMYNLLTSVYITNSNLMILTK